MLLAAATLLRTPIRRPMASATPRAFPHLCAPLSAAANRQPSTPRTPLPDGLLLVHKPSDWTSQDVVGKIRGVLEKKLRDEGHRFGRRSRLKVGHGGTLDPMATGLLVVGVGPGCRRLQQYLGGAKAYAACGQLGSEKDTQDSQGSTTATAPHDHVTLEQLTAAAASLTGNILQRPPIYSALRRDGKRLHELARAGEIRPEEVEPRPVTVYRLDVRDFDASSGSFRLGVRCGGGTYVRALIEDIGRAVGSAAHMTMLERTQHGPFCSDEEVQNARNEGRAVAAGVRPVQESEFGDASRLLAALEEAGHALEELQLTSDTADSH